MKPSVLFDPLLGRERDVSEFNLRDSQDVLRTLIAGHLSLGLDLPNDETVNALSERSLSLFVEASGGKVWCAKVFATHKGAIYHEWTGKGVSREVGDFAISFRDPVLEDMLDEIRWAMIANAESPEEERTCVGSLERDAYLFEAGKEVYDRVEQLNRVFLYWT